VNAGPAADAIKARVRAAADALAAEQRDERLIASLDEAHLTPFVAETLKWDAVLPALKKAFDDYGLQVGQGDVSVAASFIAQRPPAVRLGIVSGLDEWQQLEEINPHSRRNAEWINEVMSTVFVSERGKFSWLEEIRKESVQSSPEKLRSQIDVFARNFDQTEDASTAALHLARQLDRVGDKASAVALLRQGLKADPGDFWLNLYVGALLADEEGLRHLTAASALRPRNAIVHQVLGTAFFDAGLLEEAASEYRLALKCEPQSADVHYNLANTLKKLRTFDEAVVEHEKALAIRPAFAEAHTNLGNLHVQQGDLARAVSAYQAALTADPKLAQASLNLGNALALQGKVSSAIDAWQKTLIIDPNQTEANFNLGRAFAWRQNHEEAVKAFQKVLAIEPDNAAAQCRVGRELMLAGHFDESIAALQRGAELAKEQDAWFLPSDVWLTESRQLAVLDPDFHRILQGERKPQNSQEALAFARLAVLKGDLAFADRTLQSLLQSEPKFADDLTHGLRLLAAQCAIREQKAESWRQAVTHLKADLAVCGTWLQFDDSKKFATAREALFTWRESQRLTLLRKPPPDCPLSDLEQAELKRLWLQVDELLYPNSQPAP
jgi:tetratricopeptide (TPR) repeat protein